MLFTKIKLLKDRAEMLAISRGFFAKKHITEVDCPLAGQSASVDAHIDLFSFDDDENFRFLHSSPEYGMKRLLAEGIGDIYQLSHVFRKGELSKKHNPEFTMAEWYRLGFSFDQMIAETAEYIGLFLGELPLTILSYRQAFITYAGLDYVNASLSDLLSCMDRFEIIPYPGAEEEGKDALLNLILGSVIEPHLGQEGLTALAFYPASQAALAKTCQRDGELASLRFEIYYQGVELANGYHELSDEKEQKARLIEANHLRKHLGKEPLPIDERFLSALAMGLPECCGVAVGFDRLMMLRHQKEISEVIPFGWEIA